MSAKPLTAIVGFKTKANAARRQEVYLRLERRANQRVPCLDGSLPGDLRRAYTGDVFTAEAENVSEHGIGILCREELTAGEKIELLLPKAFGITPLMVVHCRPTADGRFRVGLTLERGRIEHLVGLFMRFGCVVDLDEGEEDGGHGEDEEL